MEEGHSKALAHQTPITPAQATGEHHLSTSKLTSLEDKRPALKERAQFTLTS